MRKSVRSSTTLAAAVAALWLCGAGSAWAGGGSGSGMSVQGVLDSICGFFPQITNCPQFPTAANDPVTPIILEIAALTNLSADVVRIQNSICAPPGLGLPLCPQIAVNAANPPARSLPPDFTAALENLTPLAFISNRGTLTATQYGDPAANSFLYAYAAASKGSGQPDTAVFVFDYVPNGNSRPAVNISFPMAVLDSASSERSVAATLTCNNAAACVNGTVTGDFVTPGTVKAYRPAQLGLQFSYRLGASPNSSTPHTMLQMLAPILVTAATDPGYFADSPCPTGVNPFSGYCLAFSTDELGFTPAFLGKPVGISPAAALGPVPPTPPNSPPGPPIVASFFGNPAVSAFSVIGTDGATVVSTPVSGSD
jgi:hypothetical protein